MYIFSNAAIICHNGSAIPESPQILGRVKGKTANVTKCTGHFSEETGAVRLGTVFHHAQIMLPGNFHNCFHIGSLSIQMNHQNRLGLLRNLLLNTGGIHIIILIRFHKNGSCSVDCNSHNTGNVGISLYNYFITCTNPQYTESNPQGVQTACQPYTVFRSYVSRKFFFKRRNLFSKYIPAGTKNFQRLFFKFFLV